MSVKSEAKTPPPRSGNDWAEDSGSVSREEEKEAKKISVNVEWFNGDEVKVKNVFFEIETDLPLRWLMILYCERVSLNFQTTQFEFNGARLRDTDTPHQLSMLDFDVIYASSTLNEDSVGHNDVHYVTLCIRLHKERDRFLRVRHTAPILPQLMRSFSDVGQQEHGSVCFVHDGLKLTQDFAADDLGLEDGDIIDAFNFGMNSSSLSEIEPGLILEVVNWSGKAHSFRVKRITRLSRVINKYRELEQLDDKAVSLHAGNGRRLCASKTVWEERLKDGDKLKLSLD